MGTKLQKHSVTGVETAYGQHSQDTESKGVKAHFRVDDSGILTMEKAEFVFERAGAEAADSGADESTFSKIGNFFFGSSEDKDGKIEEPAEEQTAASEEPKQDEKPAAAADA